MLASQLPTVCALVSDISQRSRLLQRLEGLAVVRFVPSCDTLASIRLASDAALLLVEPWDSSGVRVAPVLASLRARGVQTPIVVRCQLSPLWIRELLILATLSLSDVLITGVEDERLVLGALLAESPLSQARRTVAGALSARISTDAMGYLNECLQPRAASVVQIAERLGVDRKTIGNWVGRAGLPAPHLSLTWCRVLLAFVLLQSRRRSIECVAFTLGFDSASSLRRACRRAIGLHLTMVRHSHSVLSG